MNRVVFDVDGTLINHGDDSPRYHVIEVLKNFHKMGYIVEVHSGGGVDYAKSWVRRLGLRDYVRSAFCKCRIRDDYVPKWLIAFDDEDVKYGVVNIKV